MTAPQRLTDRKRDAIIQAAIVEFRAHGFDITSMDRIAASAGVSKRTVYNHFPSKEELFAEILNQLWIRVSAEQPSPYRPDRPLREQMRQLLTAKLQMLSDENLLDLARVAIAATIHSPERAQSMVTRMGEREENLTQWIRAAQADGRLKTVDPQSSPLPSGHRFPWACRVCRPRCSTPWWSRRWTCSWPAMSCNK
jgi:TetR/AcrR family transcriptional regulator of autoinduction and epiphytic fitness